MLMEYSQQWRDGSRIVYPAEYVLHYSAREYVRSAIKSLVYVFGNTRILEWSLLALVGWRDKETNPILLLTFLAGILHFVAYPFAEERYFVLLYLVSATSAIRLVHAEFSRDRYLVVCLTPE